MKNTSLIVHKNMPRVWDLISKLLTKSFLKALQKQECIPVGCVSSATVAMCILACTGQGGGGVYPRMHWVGGVYPRMHWAGGVCPGGSVCIPACTGQTPPCGQNDKQV